MTLTLETNEINLLGKALALMPYGEIAFLVNKIQTQINEQVQNDTSGTEPAAVE